MELNHILWEDTNWETEGKITGLLEIRVFYHGDSSNSVFIAEGTFDHAKESFTPKYVYEPTISKDTTGVSGISLQRIATIIK